MKKLSYLLASAVSALTATLPLSATARTTDLAMSDAAKQQIAKKARGQTRPSTQAVGEQSADPLQGLLFREEIPQSRRRGAPPFGEEIPQVRR